MVYEAALSERFGQSGLGWAGQSGLGWGAGQKSLGGKNMLEAGVKAPDFTLRDKDGKEITLSDFRGKKVVLYFYPKDNTPGVPGRPAHLPGPTRALRREVWR